MLESSFFVIGHSLLWPNGNEGHNRKKNQSGGSNVRCRKQAPRHLLHSQDSQIQDAGVCRQNAQVSFQVSHVQRVQLFREEFKGQLIVFIPRVGNLTRFASIRDGFDETLFFRFGQESETRIVNGRVFVTNVSTV
jgi:hypothetical protein